MRNFSDRFIVEFVNSVLERVAHAIKEEYAKEYLRERVSFFAKIYDELNGEKNRVLSPTECIQLFNTINSCYYAIERDVSLKDDPSSHYYLASVAMLKDELERLAHG